MDAQQELQVFTVSGTSPRPALKKDPKLLKEAARPPAIDLLTTTKGCSKLELSLESAVWPASICWDIDVGPLIS